MTILYQENVHGASPRPTVGWELWRAPSAAAPAWSRDLARERPGQGLEGPNSELNQRTAYLCSVRVSATVRIGRPQPKSQCSRLTIGKVLRYLSSQGYKIKSWGSKVSRAFPGGTHGAFALRTVPAQFGQDMARIVLRCSAIDRRFAGCRRRKVGVGDL